MRYKLFFFFVLVLQLSVFVSGYDQFSFLPRTGQNQSGDPNNFIPFNGNLYFTARDGRSGFGHQLWRTNGTPEGTAMFESFGSLGLADPRSFQEVGGKLFFIVELSSTRSIWVTDGTPKETHEVEGTIGVSFSFEMVGTHLIFTKVTPENGEELWALDAISEEVLLVKDIWPGPPGSSPRILGTNGTHAILRASDRTGSDGNWITDGTPDGTHSFFRLETATVWAVGSEFILIVPSALNPTTDFYQTNGYDTTFSFTLEIAVEIFTPAVRLGDYLFLGATPPLGEEAPFPGLSLYITDLTVGGTRLVKKFPDNLFDFQIELYPTLVHGLALVMAGDTLYATDGTEAGTVVLFTTPIPNIAHILGSIEGDIILVETPFEFGRIYRTDGTPSGTTLIWTGRIQENLIAGNGTHGSLVFFRCGVVTSDVQLCSTDGTPDGTGPFFVINEQDLYSPFALTPISPTVVAFVYGPSYDLYLADGTPSGTRDLDVEEGSLRFGQMLAGEGSLSKVLFYGAGSSIVSYDSTTGTTTNLTTVSFATWSFFAATSTHVLSGFFSRRAGTELWATDGSIEGTVEIGGESPPLIRDSVWNDQYFFKSSKDLWKSDGTVAGTTFVKAITNFSTILVWLPSDSLAAAYFLQYNFFESGFELWKTDGTESETVLVSRIPSSNPTVFTSAEVPELGIFLLLNAEFPKLYFFDGADPPVPLKSWPPNQVRQAFSAVSSDRFVFTLIDESDGKLWSSDGTVGGTIRITPEATQFVIAPEAMVSSPDGRGFFSASSAAEGVELWSTRGTAETTKLIPNPHLPTKLSTAPSELRVIGNRLFFFGLTRENQREVYVLDLDLDSSTPSKVPTSSATNTVTPPGPSAIFSSSYLPSPLLTHPPSPTRFHIPVVLAKVFSNNGWLKGKQLFTWGHASCNRKEHQAPASLPLTGAESASLGKGQVLKVKTDDWGGCGAFYYHYNNNHLLNLTSATQVRLWIRSTTTAKIEFEIGRGEESDEESKDHIFVESTHGEWIEVSLDVSHRTAEDLQRVYSPFLITVFGKGFAMVSNVIVVV